MILYIYIYYIRGTICIRYHKSQIRFWSQPPHLGGPCYHGQSQVVKEEVMDVLQLHTKMLQEQRLLLDKLRPW